MKNKKITVLGGAGHIGLPLSIVFANKGFDVSILDNNLKTLSLAKKGIMPFKEQNGAKNLKKALKRLQGRLIAVVILRADGGVPKRDLGWGTPLRNQRKVVTGGKQRFPGQIRMQILWARVRCFF